MRLENCPDANLKVMKQIATVKSARSHVWLATKQKMETDVYPQPRHCTFHGNCIHWQYPAQAARQGQCLFYLSPIVCNSHHNIHNQSSVHVQRAIE